MSSFFLNHSIFNWTDDFNYSKCHTYEILVKNGNWIKPTNLEQTSFLINNLGGEKVSVVLKMSVIMPYYLTDLVRQYVKDGQVIEQIVSPLSSLQEEVLRKTEEFALMQGFQKLPETYIDRVVPNIELDLAKPATIYNCLFEDE